MLDTHSAQSAPISTALCGTLEFDTTERHSIDSIDTPSIRSTRHSAVRHSSNAPQQQTCFASLSSLKISGNFIEFVVLLVIQEGGHTAGARYIGPFSGYRQATCSGDSWCVHTCLPRLPGHSDTIKPPHSTGSILFPLPQVTSSTHTTMTY